MFAANIIGESMYSKCDVDGHEYLLFKSFIDHKKMLETTVYRNKKSWSKVKRPSGSQYQVGAFITSGRTVLPQRRNNPIKVAKHAIAQGIEHESLFNWWVHHVLKKSNKIKTFVKQCSSC